MLLDKLYSRIPERKVLLIKSYEVFGNVCLVVCKGMLKHKPSLIMFISHHCRWVNADISTVSLHSEFVTYSFQLIFSISCLLPICKKSIPKHTQDLTNCSRQKSNGTLNMFISILVDTSKSLLTWISEFLTQKEVSHSRLICWLAETTKWNKNCGLLLYCWVRTDPRVLRC